MPPAGTRKTHCSRNHPLSGDNLLISSGRRRCRICHREACKRSAAKRGPVPKALTGPRTVRAPDWPPR